MPLFVLECQSCQHRWEDMVKGGAALPPCPQCNATTAQKIPSIGAAIVPIVIKPGETVHFPKRPKERKTW